MTEQASETVRRRGGREPQLTQDLVYDTALGILDAEGAAALTIRRLAKELRVATMTIYNYVDNKRDLLECAAQRAFSDLHLDLDETRPWQDQIVDVVTEFREVLATHPGMVELIAANLVHGATLDRTRDVSLGVLLRAGFGHAGAVDAISELYAFAIGYAVMAHPRQARDQDEASQLTTHPESLPNFLAVQDEWRNRLSNRGFEAGLHYILDGLAGALRDAGRPSRRK